MRRPLAILVILTLILCSVIWYANVTGQPAVLARIGEPQVSAPSLTATSAPTPPVVYNRPELQTGVAFPQYGPTAYGDTDSNWSTGLGEIEQQTGARWVEMIINFDQEYYDSPTIGVGATAPTLSSLQQGIIRAHKQGKRVFLVPLISLLHNSPENEKWSGDIACSSLATCSTWFNNYFQVYEPYLRVAQATGVEEVAVGTELQTLEILHEHYWDDFLNNVASVYTGRLTYDMNFSSIEAHLNALPTWFSNAHLYALGVSSYFSLVDTPIAVPARQLSKLWMQRVRAPLDTLSQATGKPIILSELGYRNDVDALYEPYITTQIGAPDPALQAAVYNAAMQNIVQDTHLVGVYIWAWSVPVYEPNNLPAAATLHTWYTSPQA